MTLLLKQIFAFFRMLNSETGTNQLASGLAIGLVLGFSPFLSLQTFIVLMILLFFRIQMGAAFLAAFFFKFIAYLIDPFADLMGRRVLEAPGLQGLWTDLYHMPLVPLTRFNDSIVMGSGLIGFILAIPAFFIFRILIQKYRLTVVQKFQQTKIWKAWTATSFYKWYCTYQDLYG